jgi:hypothetical protein
VRAPWLLGLLALLAGLPACGARTGLDVPPVVVHQEDCVETGVSDIYVVTSQNQLFAFDPQTAVFNTIGDLNCVDPLGGNPFSMAVARHDYAYVVFDSGSLFRVSTADASCTPTGYVPDQLGFKTFGMGFSTNYGGPAETMFVAESSFGGDSKGLATIDTTSFTASFVAPFTPDVANAIELTGTGDGRLYGLFINTTDLAASIGPIDKTTGDVASLAPFSTGLVIDSFAFAFWGGEFYVFHSGNGPPTTVTRFDATTGAEEDVAMLNGSVVGVGVSTCAPVQ